MMVSNPKIMKKVKRRNRLFNENYWYAMKIIVQIETNTKFILWDSYRRRKETLANTVSIQRKIKEDAKKRR